MRLLKFLTSSALALITTLLLVGSGFVIGTLPVEPVQKAQNYIKESGLSLVTYNVAFIVDKEFVKTYRESNSVAYATAEQIVHMANFKFTSVYGVKFKLKKLILWENKPEMTLGGYLAAMPFHWSPSPEIDLFVGVLKAKPHKKDSLKTQVGVAADKLPFVLLALDGDSEIVDYAATLQHEFSHTIEMNHCDYDACLLNPISRDYGHPGNMLLGVFHSEHSKEFIENRANLLFY